MVAHLSLLLSRRNLKQFIRENAWNVLFSSLFIVALQGIPMQACLRVQCLLNANGGPSNVNAGQ